jgi:hypothetical protein
VRLKTLAPPLARERGEGKNDKGKKGTKKKALVCSRLIDLVLLFCFFFYCFIKCFFWLFFVFLV